MRRNNAMANLHSLPNEGNTTPIARVNASPDLSAVAEDPTSPPTQTTPPQEPLLHYGNIFKFVSSVVFLSLARSYLPTYVTLLLVVGAAGAVAGKKFIDSLDEEDDVVVEPVNHQQALDLMYAKQERQLLQNNYRKIIAHQNKVKAEVIERAKKLLPFVGKDNNAAIEAIKLKSELIPSNYLCSITQKIMTNPVSVIGMEPKFFEMANILGTVHPVTKKIITEQDVIRAVSLNNEINYYVKKCLFVIPQKMREAVRDGIVASWKVNKELFNVDDTRLVPMNVDTTQEDIRKFIATEGSCYSVLGLKRNAKPHAIEARYKELVRALHPDRNPCPLAAARYIVVSKARNILMDAASRKYHDAHTGLSFDKANLKHCFLYDTAPQGSEERKTVVVPFSNAPAKSCLKKSLSL